MQASKEENQGRQRLRWTETRGK